MNSPALDMLAAYLTGTNVAHHSVMLQTPAGTPNHDRAVAFFALRGAFGVQGYANADEARVDITRALTKGCP